MCLLNSTTLNKTKDLVSFSKQFKFKEFDKKKDISNTIPCNTDNLKICNLNNPNDLYGCREFYVECHHFDQDVIYFENKVKKTIPKNNKNEGYALPITSKLEEKCNIYHGDLTLISKNDNLDEYMLICKCKEPGYIGNDHILGNCTTVRICNSKIDDINQPLEKINCICDQTEQSVRLNQTPSCKTYDIVSANEKFEDWSHLLDWSSKQTIPKQEYNKTVQDNLHNSQLLNPCTYSLLDSTIEIPNAKYDAVNKTCTLTDYGLPVRNNNLADMKKTYKSHDDKIDIDYKQIDAVIHTDKYESLRIVDRIQSKTGKINKRIGLKTKLPFLKNKSVRININEPTTFGYNSQLLLSTKEQFVSGNCHTDYPTYNCEYSDAYDYTYLDIPRPKFSELPGGYLWGRETWEDFNRLGAYGINVANYYGLSLIPDIYLKRDEWLNYGIQFCNKDSDKSCLNGFLRFNNPKDYKLHKELSME